MSDWTAQAFADLGPVLEDHIAGSRSVEPRAHLVSPSLFGPLVTLTVEAGNQRARDAGTLDRREVEGVFEHTRRVCHARR